MSPELSRATISAVDDDDLAEVLAIYNHYIAHSTVTFDEQPMSLDALVAKVALVRASQLPYLVAKDESGQVLGFAYASTWRPKSAYRRTAESTIYLAEAAAGRGLGRILLGELLSASADAGLRELIAVISDRGAERSIALHKRAGFVETGHLRDVGFKFDQWLGTHLLQKSLWPAVSAPETT